MFFIGRVLTKVLTTGFIVRLENGKKIWSGKSQGKRKTNKKSGKNIFYYIFNIVLGI